MAYSGAWRSGAYKQPSLAGSVPALDHREPQDQPNSSDNWKTAPDNPPLPPAEVIDDFAFSVDQSAGGPVFQPPKAHETPASGVSSVRVGPGPVLPPNAAHMGDDGSYAARRYHAPVLQDGKYSNGQLQMSYDVAGLRPAGTPDLPVAPGMQQQLNPSEYPNRRVGHFFQRLTDRVFQRVQWNVEYRPVVVPNAYTATPAAASGTQNQYTSPYAPAQSTQVRVVNTVAPQMRRTPDPWDESITVDGTEQNVSAIPDYGFASFGGF